MGDTGRTVLPRIVRRTGGRLQGPPGRRQVDGTFAFLALPAASVGEASAVRRLTLSAGSPYLITAAINDDANRVKKIHSSLAEYAPSQGHLHLGAPLHPGAERYYREKGWLR